MKIHYVINCCLALLSSLKLPFAADKNKYKDPQPEEKRKRPQNTQT